MNLNKLRDEAYQNAIEHGWHENELSDKHYLMLIISELAEAIEADRRNKHANITQYKHLEEYALREKMLYGETLDQYLKEAFENEIKDTMEDELSDVVIRCLDFAGLRHFNLIEDTSRLGIGTPRLQDITFTEWTFELTDALTDAYCFFTIEITIPLVIMQVYQYCKFKGIDIEWHIKAKMEYNKTRIYKHGKNY